MAVTSRNIALLIDLIGRDIFVPGGPVERRVREQSNYASGVSDGQVDLLWMDLGRTTPAAGANETIDLSGSLTDIAGTTLTFVDISVIALRNNSTTAGDQVQWGPNSSNGFLGPWADASDRTVVDPGVTGGKAGWSVFVSPRGWTVTAGTGDLLYLEELGGANAANIDLFIAGRTA